MFGSSKSDPLSFSISLARYTLDPNQLENFASEYYGKVLEASGVESGSNHAADFGAVPESDAPDLTIHFKDRAHKVSFVEALDSTFLRQTAS